MKVKFKKIRDVKMPTYGTDGAAAFEVTTGKSEGCYYVRWSIFGDGLYYIEV